MGLDGRRLLAALAVLGLAACGGDDNPSVGTGKDTDGDGYSDFAEQQYGHVVDTDMDGIPDYQDADSHPPLLDVVASGGGPTSCASANVNTSTAEPRVTLVLDGSTSMADPLGGGGGARWTAMRSALMDPDGVVMRLQPVVEFGMVVYNGSLGSLAGGFGGGGQPVAMAMNGSDCPGLWVTPPALNNHATLDAALPQMQPGGSTPTHLALNHVVDPASGILSAAGSVLDDDEHPQILILATDGQPNNLCGGGSAIADPAAAQGVLDAVITARNMGVRTYVISLAGGDQGLQAHLEQVAVEGGTGQPPFTPQSRDELVGTLSAIVGGAIGCNILLNGTVQAGSECMGLVALNGRPLGCGTDWRLSTPTTIELLGQACDDFMANPESMVHAEFPCGVFVEDSPD
ncbi:MAG: VWA domain-containing protein [Myxococcales bacterium]|nr:VWA domain-containing protein [Myxococcales bacterium]